MLRLCYHGNGVYYDKLCVDFFLQESSPRQKTIRISFTNVEDEAESALQARVAQQSELISLLKSRSDDTLLQVSLAWARP